MAARTRTTAVRPIVNHDGPRGARKHSADAMLGAEMHAPETCPQPPRPIVDAANAGLAPDKRLECSGIAVLGFTSQGVLRAGQGGFNAGTPLLNGSVGAPFDDDGLAEPGQRFGMALFPEGILQSQRQNDRLFQAVCEMSHSRLNARRAFARVGKAALRRDPERGPRSSEDRAAGAEELPRPSHCPRLDAKHAHTLEDPIPPERVGVHGRVMGTVRKQLGQHQAYQRVPPGGVIEHDDQRAVRHRARSATP